MRTSQTMPVFGTRASTIHIAGALEANPVEGDDPRRTSHLPMSQQGEQGTREHLVRTRIDFVMEG